MGGGGRSGCSAHARPPTAIPSGPRSSAPAHSLHTGAASRRVPRAGLDPHQGTHETMGWGRGRKPPTDRRGEGAPGLTVLVPGCSWPGPLPQTLCSACPFPGAGSPAAATGDARWLLTPGGIPCGQRLSDGEEAERPGRWPSTHGQGGLQKQESVCGPGPSVHPTSPDTQGEHPSPRDRQLTGKADQIRRDRNCPCHVHSPRS